MPNKFLCHHPQSNQATSAATTRLSLAPEWDSGLSLRPQPTPCELSTVLGGTCSPRTILRARLHGDNASCDVATPATLRIGVKEGRLWLLLQTNKSHKFEKIKLWFSYFLADILEAAGR
jgi:hypothetical protein